MSCDLEGKKGCWEELQGEASQLTKHTHMHILTHSNWLVVVNLQLNTGKK